MMDENNMKTLLRLDSGARHEGSVSRTIGDEVVRRLRRQHPTLTVTEVDLTQGIGHIDADWVAANFTPDAERSPMQRDRLSESDRAVATLRDADALVLTAPIYNFSVPSVLKAWIDQVCRAGLTFRYTASGPQGLLPDRPVYLVMASGGVPFGSPVDFASPYLRQVFRFVGIEDVRLIGAAGTAADPEVAHAAALVELNRWLPEESANVA